MAKKNKKPDPKPRSRKRKTFTVTVTDTESKQEHVVYVCCCKKTKAARIGILVMSDFHNLKTSQLTAKAELTPGITKGLDPANFNLFVASKKND
jgi:AmiR/NasT family two-component response regulator